jgi:hypothetical protein
MHSNEPGVNHNPDRREDDVLAGIHDGDHETADWHSTETRNFVDMHNREKNGVVKWTLWQRQCVELSKATQTMFMKIHTGHFFVRQTCIDGNDKIFSLSVYLNL